MSRPGEMKDMRVVTQWPSKIKMAHGQLKSSPEFKDAKQLNKDSYVKIDFRSGKVALVITGKTVKVLDAWSISDSP